MSEYQKIADCWRTQQTDSLRATSGIVLIWENEVYGWKDTLRDASHERPNAIAVDTDGSVFVAEGGNDYDGAEAWVKNSPSP